MSSSWEGVESRVDALERYVYDLEKRVKESLDHVVSVNTNVNDRAQGYTEDS